MKSDRKIPSVSSGDIEKSAGKFRFYTKRGFLTPYALACGYVEIRGDSESGVRLERTAGATYRVCGTGRWIRGEGEQFFETLSAARRYFMTYDHRYLSEVIRAKHFERPADFVEC